ncbi:hypothetical protein AACH10_24040 [Ideonella sp. DXS22W]|uniref:ATP-grasp domain-containing protein n=1 Tax=Pseudaquabacterium inlustre TaxID=2984192 RepID=A0ABU9CNF2_9BURK
MTTPPINARFAALVLGVDSHGLAAVRALNQAGVPTYALDKDTSLPGARSNQFRRLFSTPSFEAADLLPVLRQVRQQLSAYDEVALMAMNDRQVEVIGRHQAAVTADYRVAWIDQADTILRLQRKNELETHSRQHGLNYPRTVQFDSPGDANLAMSMRFPMIIKPVRPLSSFKTQMAANPADLDRWLQRYQADLPILGQEFIAGDDRAIYFGALLLERGRLLFGMTGRKLASYPPSRGQTTVAETVDEPQVLQLTQQFFAGLRLSGPVSLELKRAPDGSFWVIEPTVGRTDFWVGLCIGAGFNQPLMEFQLATGQPVTMPTRTEGCTWYDSERDPTAYPRLALNNRCLRPLNHRQVFSYLHSSDWRPAIHAVGRRLRSVVLWSF